MSLQNEYESYLAHYGVPGMKWGIRKANAAYKKYDKYANRMRKLIAVASDYANRPSSQTKHRSKSIYKSNLKLEKKLRKSEKLLDLREKKLEEIAKATNSPYIKRTSSYLKTTIGMPDKKVNSLLGSSLSAAKNKVNYTYAKNWFEEFKEKK